MARIKHRKKGIKNVQVDSGIIQNILNMRSDRFIKFPIDDKDEVLFFKSLNVDDLCQEEKAIINNKTIFVDFNWVLRKNFYTLFFYGVERNDDYYSLSTIIGFVNFIKMMLSNYPDYNICFVLTPFKFSAPKRKTKYFNEITKIVYSYVPTIAHLISYFENFYFLSSPEMGFRNSVANCTFSYPNNEHIIYSNDDSLIQLCAWGNKFASKMVDGKFDVVTSEDLNNKMNLSFKSFLMYKAIVGDSKLKLPKVDSSITRQIASEFSNISIVYGYETAVKEIEKTNKEASALLWNRSNIVHSNLDSLSLTRFSEESGRKEFEFFKIAHPEVAIFDRLNLNDFKNFLSGTY